MSITRCAGCLFAIHLLGTAALAEDKKEEPNIPITGQAVPELASFDKLLRDFVARNGIPGASLAVVKDGRLVYARGFGYADRKKKAPVQPFSLFRIASISKPVTAVAIFRLIDEGKLSLDDKVFKILKYKPLLVDGAQYDKRHDAITIRQLLQHTGGWDRGASFDPMFRPVEIAKLFKVDPPAKPEYIIRYMLGRTLDFDPGKKYAYSNFGYCLLGRVIEKKTGRPYDEYVRTEILKPIGVSQMQIGRSRLKGRRKNEVRYYRWDGKKGKSVFASDLGKPVLWPYGSWYLEAMDSHGAWIASAVDLAKFAAAFDQPKKSSILKPASLKAMFAPPPKPVSRNDDGKLEAKFYACGWSVEPVKESGRFNCSHTGSLDGTSTMLLRGHDGMSAAILFNTRKTRSGKIPSRTFAPRLRKAADQIKEWPAHDLFSKFK